MDLTTLEQLVPMESISDSFITVDNVSRLTPSFSSSGDGTAAKLSTRGKTQRLVLPKIDALTRSIHACLSEKNTFKLALGQESLLSFTIYPNSTYYPNSTHNKFPYNLHLCVDQHPLVLQIDHTLLNTALSDLGTGAPLELIPDKLLLSLLQTSIAPLLSSLALSLDASVELTSLDKNINSATTVNQLVLKAQCTGMVCQAGLRITAATLPYLKKLLKKCRVGDTPSSLIHAIPFHISAAIQGIKLSVSDIASLERNDLILLDKPFDSYLSDILIASGDHVFFSARYEANTLIICHEIEEHTMHDKLTEASLNQAQNLTEKIKVDVVFELARKKITLDELNKLTPGKIIDLDKPLSSLVTIRANGIPIATAELVEIDERVGARVTELLIKETPLQ